MLGMEDLLNVLIFSFCFRCLSFLESAFSSFPLKPNAVAMFLRQAEELARDFVRVAMAASAAL